MPYDVTTDVGKVRLLISDIGGTSGEDFIFEDKEVQAFLDLKSVIELAAAQALRTIAANTALVLKTIKFMEITTNGSETAKALVLVAKEMEEAYERGEEYIDLVDMVDNTIYELAEEPANA